MNQNQIPNDPELKDLLDLFRKDIFLHLNCHAIAKIQSFNQLTQSATATVNYKKTFFEPNTFTGVYDQKLVDYPILVDCPVMFLGGGGTSITFPVENGDDCMVFFNDRDMDNWYKGSSSSPNATPRLHSFSDGIILVGLRSLNNVILNFDTDGIALRTRDGLTKIKVFTDGSKITLEAGPFMKMVIKPDGTISITNGITEFVSALDQLFKDVQSGLVTTLLGPQPLVMPTFAVDLLKFETFKS